MVVSVGEKMIRVVQGAHLIEKVGHQIASDRGHSYEQYGSATGQSDEHSYCANQEFGYRFQAQRRPIRPGASGLLNLAEICLLYTSRCV